MDLAYHTVSFVIMLEDLVSVQETDCHGDEREKDIDHALGKFGARRSRRGWRELTQHQYVWVLMLFAME